MASTSRVPPTVGCESSGGLDHTGWLHSAQGNVAKGKPQSDGGGEAFFKHSQPLQAQDVMRMRYEGGDAIVGFADKGYDVDRDRETEGGLARVSLCDGTTDIYSGISEDGEDHEHYCFLQPFIPKNSKPYDMLSIPKAKHYDVALRISKDGNIPQIQFNDDGVWHDFAPEGGPPLKAGPWFPYLLLFPGDRLSNIRVDRPKATKSAGMKRSTSASNAAVVNAAMACATAPGPAPGPAAPDVVCGDVAAPDVAVAGDAAVGDAAAGLDDESDDESACSPPQKKARDAGIQWEEHPTGPGGTEERDAGGGSPVPVEFSLEVHPVVVVSGTAYSVGTILTYTGDPTAEGGIARMPGVIVKPSCETVFVKPASKRGGSH